MAQTNKRLVLPGTPPRSVLVGGCWGRLGALDGEGLGKPPLEDSGASRAGPYEEPAASALEPWRNEDDEVGGFHVGVEAGPGLLASFALEEDTEALIVGVEAEALPADPEEFSRADRAGGAFLDGLGRPRAGR